MLQDTGVKHLSGDLAQCRSAGESAGDRLSGSVAGSGACGLSLTLVWRDGGLILHIGYRSVAKEVWFRCQNGEFVAGKCGIPLPPERSKSVSDRAW
ncbi:hypothetical protein D3C71_1599910 [compost metagenome]